MSDHSHSPTHEVAHAESHVTHDAEAHAEPAHEQEIGKLSPIVNALIEIFEDTKSTATEGFRLSVSKTVSALAVAYEKARNAVEFRAEHLVRRAAIERILKRRVTTNGGADTIAEYLVIELLWAKYIDSSLLDDGKVREIKEIIDRYLYVKERLFSNTSKHGTLSWDTMLGIASAEIDETMVSATKRQALIDFMYQAMRPKITSSQDEKIVDIQTYIAIERAYAQSDVPLIMFHLLRIIQPEWIGLSRDHAEEHLLTLTSNLESVNTNLRDSLGDAIFRFVKRRTPPFLLIRDFFLEHSDKTRELITKQSLLDAKLTEIASEKYKQIGTKVRRAVLRSIIYLFLTKMLLALLLEVPVDIFITKRIDYIPLFINALFPPVLLFFIAGFVSVPAEDNTRKLVKRINKVLYQFDDLAHEGDMFTDKVFNRRPILTAIFSIFYLIAFAISFGVIYWILSLLHFNVASKLIFVFFMTLVTFFAYRIRQSAKEYEVVDGSGFIGPMIDFFFLPILRVGHILSSEIAKLNIFMFLFDFILEAPLKVIFDVVEEWIRFIRSKKEEMIA